MKDVDAGLKSDLHEKIDGRGLVWCSAVPSVHRWVTDGTTLLTGSDFIQAVKVRGNLLPSRMRMRRGRDKQNVNCDAGCNAIETLSHISQSCARTHRLRTARHDSILDTIEKNIIRAGLKYVREPAIHTVNGIRKPDLVVQSGTTVIIADLTITADHVSMHNAWQQKFSYYDKHDIKAWALERFPECANAKVEGIVVNWRGAIYKRSSEVLKEIGTTMRSQTIIVVRTLTYTANMFKHFTRSTTRGTN